MKVSVLMITYKHENFIKEAIESILSQIVNFDVELIISDDFSPDFTKEVVNSIVNTSTVIIRYFRQTENIGMQKNFEFTYSKATGEYIALCEGDDYWIDNLKLQKQIDFLDQNIKYTLCASQSIILKKGGTFKNTTKTGEIVFDDVIEKNVISTASIVYRSTSLSYLSKMLYQVPAGDWMLQILALESGLGYIFKDFMSVYRVHNDGVWSQLSKKKMGMLGIQTLVILHLHFKNNMSKVKIKSAIKNRIKHFNLSTLDVFEIYLKVILQLISVKWNQVTSRCSILG